MHVYTTQIEDVVKKITYFNIQYFFYKNYRRRISYRAKFAFSFSIFCGISFVAHALGTLYYYPLLCKLGNEINITCIPSSLRTEKGAKKRQSAKKM
jgi:hypothetical protein